MWLKFIRNRQEAIQQFRSFVFPLYPFLFLNNSSFVMWYTTLNWSWHPSPIPGFLFPNVCSEFLFSLYYHLFLLFWTLVISLQSYYVLCYLFRDTSTHTYICVFTRLMYFKHVNRPARWAQVPNNFHIDPEVLMCDFYLWILKYKGNEAFLKSKQRKDCNFKLRAVFSVCWWSRMEKYRDVDGKITFFLVLYLK